MIYSDLEVAGIVVAEDDELCVRSTAVRSNTRRVQTPISVVEVLVLDGSARKGYPIRYPFPAARLPSIKEGVSRYHL